MPNPALMRARYVTDAVGTASPGRLIVMLYDRLLLDLDQAESSLRAEDRSAAAARLLHAQEIVLELRAGLDLSAWSGAAGLAQLYTFLTTELIKANVRGDADRVAVVRRLVEPLAEAWREAALAAAAGPAELAVARVG
jgi:flagellar secretion chaperone FliS